MYLCIFAHAPIRKAGYVHTATSLAHAGHVRSRKIAR